MVSHIRVLYERCCGIDVHKKMIEACILTSNSQERQRFGTTTREITRCIAWLKQHDVPVVAMESTGVYWKPLYNLFEEAGIQVILANAHNMKAVPGRKTDVKDAQWIASLLRHGLLKASFVPDRHQRELRDLLRLRTAKIQERSREIQRIQKILTCANIRLSSVVSNVVGATSRAILEAIVAGQKDPQGVASIAAGSQLRASQEVLTEALEGHLGELGQTMLVLQLEALDFLDRQIAQIDTQVDRLAADDERFKRALELLDGIPGIGIRIAQVIIAEAGLDMSRFPSAKHFAAWAGMAPGNNESAGKRKSGKTKPGNPHLRSHLVQAARSLSHRKDCFLADQYHRLRARRGSKRATIAVGHSILIIAYCMLKRDEPYMELGSNYHTEKRKEHRLKYLVHEIGKLGVGVSLVAR